LEILLYLLLVLLGSLQEQPPVTTSIGNDFANQVNLNSKVYTNFEKTSGNGFNQLSYGNLTNSSNQMGEVVINSAAKPPSVYNPIAYQGICDSYGNNQAHSNWLSGSSNSSGCFKETIKTEIMSSSHLNYYSNPSSSSSSSSSFSEPIGTLASVADSNGISNNSNCNDILKFNQINYQNKV
jgi:hypothetical protein